MSDIFVSYATADRERIQPLIRALEATGWSVFWDRATPTGMIWQDFIGGEVDGCHSMIVVWSHESVKSRWVREEANDAMAREILLPTRIDEVRPLFGFRQVQAADFIGVSESDMPAACEGLINDLARLLGPPPSAKARAEAAERAQREAAAQKRRKLPKSDGGRRRGGCGNRSHP